MRVIRSRAGVFRACYEHERDDHPDLGGEVVVAFTIDDAGRVIVASLAKSTVGNDYVDACVVRQLETLEFPAGSRRKLKYTFGFSTG